MNYFKLLIIGLLCGASLMSAIAGYAQTGDDINKSSKEYFKIGVDLEKARLFVEAISQFNRAIALDSKCIDAYVHKGLSLRELGRYRESIESFREVLEIDPTYTRSYVYMGETYIKQGDMDKAKEVYDQLVKIDENKAAQLLEVIQEGPTNRIIRN